MTRYLSIAIAACAFASPARALTILSIDDHTAVVGAASIDIPVVVSTDSADVATDLGGIVASGGGGTVTGNPAAPPITNITLAGTIWDGAPSGFESTNFFDASGTGEIWQADVSLAEAAEAVTLNGTLLVFTLDISGLGAGESFALSMEIPGQQSSALGNAGAAVPVAFQDGSITMVIPEPRAWALIWAALPALCLAFWVRRRHRRGTTTTIKTQNAPARLAG